MATRTWVAAETVTAANINTYLQQRDAWVTYTPTLTGVTSGNGTLVAVYNQVGRIVHWTVKFTLGNTSAITGVITVTLPATAARTEQHPLSADFKVAGAFMPARAIWGSTSRIDLYAPNVAATYMTYSNTSATVPATWTTNDYFAVGGVYEAATAP